MAKLNLKKVLEDLVEVQWLEDPEEKEKAFDLLKAISQDDSEEAIEFITKLNSAITEIVKGDEVEEITPEEKPVEKEEPKEVEEKDPEETKEESVKEEKETVKEEVDPKTMVAIDEKKKMKTWRMIKEGTVVDMEKFEESLDKEAIKKLVGEEFDDCEEEIEESFADLDKERFAKRVSGELNISEAKVTDTMVNDVKTIYQNLLKEFGQEAVDKVLATNPNGIVRSVERAIQKAAISGSKEEKARLPKDFNIKEWESLTDKQIATIMTKAEIPVGKDELKEAKEITLFDAEKLPEEKEVVKEEKKETIEESVVNKAVNLLDGDYESKMMVNDVAMNAANLL